MTRITGTLLEDVFTFNKICHLVLTMRNISIKSCRQNQNTHFVFSNFFSKILPRVRYVKKYGGARDTMDNVIMA
jgi:hypothetical protein